MRNIEEMRGELYRMIDEVRSMVQTAEGEQRSLSGEEEEKKTKLMDAIRKQETAIADEEELQRVEAQRAKNHTDPEKDRAEWRSLGEFVQAVINNPGDRRLKDREVELRQPPPQQQTVGAAGGFLVPEIFAEQVLTVSPDEAIIRPRATVFGPDGDNTFRIPAIDYDGTNMYGGAAVDWINEGQAKPEASVNFEQIALTPFEVAAHIPVTDRLLRSSNLIEQIVRTQLRGALIDAEEDAFLNGAGGFQPLGIINHGATIQVTRAANDAIAFADVAGMYQVFRGRRGVWIVSRDVLAEFMELQDANNNYIWQPNARDGSPGTLFGYPVFFSDHSPAMDQTASVVLADLSYYLIKDGTGLTIAASQHQAFTQNRTIIKAFKTVDATPWLAAALPTTVATSPFVQIQNI